MWTWEARREGKRVPEDREIRAATVMHFLSNRSFGVADVEAWEVN